MQIHKRDRAKRVLLLGWVAGFLFLSGQADLLWSQSRSISLPVKKKAAPAPPPKVTKLAPSSGSVSPTGYQSLLAWGKNYGLKAYWVRKSKQFRLADGTHTLDFEVDRSCIVIDGVRVWIGKPIKIVNGRICIDAQDIATALDPILSPVKTRKAVRVVLLDRPRRRASGGGLPGKKEKDYVLLIAKEIQRLLQEKGLKVVMTRSGDQTLGLTPRSNIGPYQGGSCEHPP